MVETGDLDQALKDIETALNIEPANESALATRGNIRRELGDYDGAISDLDRALELDSDFAWAYRAKGQTLLALGRDGEALAAFDEALRQDPNLPRVAEYRLQVDQRLRVDTD